MPLKRRTGEVFGTLCALDPRPGEDLEEHLETFHLISELIGFHLEAQQLHEERERFLGVLGHDLRSPLQSIELSADLIRRDPGLHRRSLQAVDRIGRAGRRIEAMVGDLLDFTRGRFGEGLALDRRPVDVEALLVEVVDEKLAVTEGRELHLRRGDHLGRAAWDAQRVAQLLVNLLTNALAHGPVERPVTLSAEGDDEAVTFEVHNFGAPIQPQAMAQIFLPFSQAAETSAGSRSGLGLGLYIVSLIAQAHDGRVSVTSTAEDGTRFRVRLPRGTS